MKALRTLGHFLLALCMLATVSACLQGQPGQQASQTKPFQPTRGQAGKDVVWVPTAQPVVNKMLDLAKVTPKDYLIDLGSGDGRIVITAARRGARALGIEFNPDMVKLSKANAAKAGVSGRATFMNADLFKTDFSKATVITMFLLPDLNLRLRPTILKMKPGTRVVSDSFYMEDWTPDETATVQDGCSTYCTALLWIVPAKVAGKWQLGGGELALAQQFQVLSGSLTLNGNNTPISDAKMTGDQIAFTAGGTVYTGRLTGNVIKGTADSGGSTSPWTATREEK
jgi:hypothetical protein